MFVIKYFIRATKKSLFLRFEDKFIRKGLASIWFVHVYCVVCFCIHNFHIPCMHHLYIFTYFIYESSNFISIFLVLAFNVIKIFNIYFTCMVSWIALTQLDPVLCDLYCIKIKLHWKTALLKCNVCRPCCLSRRPHCFQACKMCVTGRHGSIQAFLWRAWFFNPPCRHSINHTSIAPWVFE